MNRRGFLTTCASLLPLPAFVKAASLWLPPERPRIAPLTAGFVFLDSECEYVPRDDSVLYEALYTRASHGAKWTRGCTWVRPGWDWIDPANDVDKLGAETTSNHMWVDVRLPELAELSLEVTGGATATPTVEQESD